MKLKLTGRQRILFISAAVFLALALLFGAVLGTVVAVRESRAVVSYRGATVTEEELCFFVSAIKPSYIAALKAEGYTEAADMASFWVQKYDGEMSHGDRFIAFVKDYLAEIAVCEYLFDKYSSLDAYDRERIDTAVTETLDFKANGDISEFNRLAEEYGFDYDSFKSAARILYKAQMAYSRIYGSGGESLIYATDECEKYLAEYDHVKLLFIRTETKFLTDAYGERVPDASGNDTLVPLTDEERAERAALIAEIRAAVDGYKTGADVQMSSESFDIYLAEHGEGDKTMNACGYYFHKDSAYTKEFSEEFSEIVKLASEMEIGDFDEVKTSVGVCFVYKYKPTAGAYIQKATEVFFGDFFANGSVSLFAETVDGLVPYAKVKTDKYGFEAVLDIPKNSIFIPRF